MSEPRVIVALDYSEAATALAFADRVSPQMCRLKVGKELFTAAGPSLIETLAERGFDVFLDLKFHDIPTTVAAACKTAARLGVWMLNVHALGGRAMMEAARSAISQSRNRPKLIAVTVLTSLLDADLAEVGLSGGVDTVTDKLAKLARAVGLDGVVCSPQEARVLRRECGPHFLLVTPGIRLDLALRHDQRRVATPQEATAAGADFIVIGRPITQASDPAALLATINRELVGSMRAHEE